MRKNNLFSTAKRHEEQTTLFCSSQTDFEDDIQKIIHCSAFRRLQAKTQVWGIGSSDFFRTRLTHTLETAQIASQLAKLFHLPEKGVIACALAHDLGHPPFAHEGAHLIDQFCRAKSNELIGFDDNTQNIRIIGHLTAHPVDPDIQGLNLSAAVIDGLQKTKQRPDRFCGYPQELELVKWASRACGTGECLHPFAVILELADDISYACHDFEDALRAQMIPHEELQRSNANPFTNNILENIAKTLEPLEVTVKHCRMHKSRIKHAILSELFNRLKVVISPYLLESMQAPISRDDHPIFSHAPDLYETLKWLKNTVKTYVIEQSNVQSHRFAHLKSLENYLQTYWTCIRDKQHPLHQHAILSLPDRWRKIFEKTHNTNLLLRTLIDYVVGMSDDYFIQQASLMENPKNKPALEIWK